MGDFTGDLAWLFAHFVWPAPSIGTGDRFHPLLSFQRVRTLLVQSQFNIRIRELHMSRTQTAVTTGGICCCAMLAILAASKPITAQAQIKPTVTVVNPVSNPVNARITNSIVPVDFSNAGQYTHVGQKPSRVVNLAIFIDRSRRIDPVTAQADSESFQVPEGFVFVLTDIQMFNACAPGTEVGYALRHRSSVIDAPRDLIRGICPATGEVSLNRHYSTGMLFGAGSEVYIATGNVTNLLMYGQGYLVPAN